jgi:hypothetical protein
MKSPRRSFLASPAGYLVLLQTCGAKQCGGDRLFLAHLGGGGLLILGG